MSRAGIEAIDKACDYLSDWSRTRLMHYAEARRRGRLAPPRAARIAAPISMAARKRHVG